MKLTINGEPRELAATTVAEALAAGYEARLASVAARATGPRPTVYFEEWDEPPITGIRCWRPI